MWSSNTAASNDDKVIYKVIDGMFMSAICAKIFMSWKMECSFQWGGAELNGTFHLFTNEKHSSFVLYNIQEDLYQDTTFKTNKAYKF